MSDEKLQNEKKYINFFDHSFYKTFKFKKKSLGTSLLVFFVFLSPHQPFYYFRDIYVKEEDEDVRKSSSRIVVKLFLTSHFSFAYKFFD